MELDEFITTTLTQIAKGVADAQQKVQELGGSVNPTIYVQGGRGRSPRNPIKEVAFDVAVTVQEGASGGARGKLAVMGVGVSGGGELTTQNISVSRIQFVIPVQVASMKGATAVEKDYTVAP